MNNAKSLKLEAYSLTERNINFKRNNCISEQGYIPSRVHVCTFVHKISEVIHVVGKAWGKTHLFTEMMGDKN